MRLPSPARAFHLPIVAILAMLIGVGPLAAQTSKGILAGIVRDPSGALVANASLTAVNQDTGETRTTNSSGDGAYRMEALTAGRYTVSVTQAGFKLFKITDLPVNTSVVTSQDITLVTGGTSEVVNVEAEATGINTENGQLAGVISAKQLQDLPIFSLNPIELATTVPGVQFTSEGGGFSNGINIEVNGARPRANNFLLDGQEINDVGIGGQAFQPQIPDIFQSFAVITNSAAAEYGRAGGAVVNLVTKAGSNRFHGSVFERYTGSGLNALDGVTRQGKPFAAGSANPKARFNQHSYGFTAGGPIIKDKLFAFGALQLQRFYGKETPTRLELPDAAGYATLQGIGGPQVTLLDSYLSNGDYLKSYVSFPGNGVVTKINVGAQKGCPATGCIVTTGFFQRQNASESNPDTQWMYRIDFNPREKDNFSFRYLHDRGSLSPDFGNNGRALVGFDTQQGGPTELGAGTWTHIFGPSVVNELRASEARLSFAFAPTAQTSANPLFALSTINISNIPSLGPNQNFPQGRAEDLYQLQDTVGINRGRHSLRVGFDIGRILESDTISLNAKGTLNFARGGPFVTSLGNFLQNQLGPSGSATKVFGSTRTDPHGWRSGVFAQDDIKLNPDLTLNLGVRYDYLTNPENSLKYPAIDPNNPYAPIDTVYKVHTDTNNIGPRFGFAYTPHGEGFMGGGKSVVRGGIGVFYDSSFSNITVNAAQSAPNAVAGLLTSTTGGGLTNATSLIGQITPVLSPRAAVTSLVNNTVNPVTYQYNFGVERQLPASTVLAVRYVGSTSKKLFANKQFNYFSNGARLNTVRGQVNARGNFASSNYNSVQVDATHSFSRGFQVNATYTFGKDLDNGSEIFTTSSAPTSYQSNLGPGGFTGEYGPSVYDHRHYVSVSYVWSPTGFHSDNGLANAALGALTRHWSLSGIEQFQSGTYSTFNNSGFDTNGDGSSVNDRPIRTNASAPLGTAAIDGHFIGGKNGVYYDLGANNASGALTIIDPSTVHWLVPYQPNNEFLSREIGRNSFSNPGTMVNNIALQKGVGLSYLHLEQGQLVLRAEAQNFLNHNDVGILDTNVADIGSDNYLNRSNARQTGGRTMVLWAKILF